MKAETVLPVRLRPHLPFLLVGLSLLVACGESSTAPADGDDPPVSGSDLATCEWISPALTSAMPMERVEVGPAPDSLERPIWVEVRAPGDTTTGYTWLEPATSTDSLVVPLHPLGDADGGSVELSVTDGSVTCEPVDFTVEALPEAPGTTQETADSLATAIELQAEILGITGQELAEASFDTLGVERIPLAIAQSVVSHGENGNSLAAIAQGDSEEFGDVDLTMADRLLARTGFPELVTAHLAHLREVRASIPAAPGREGPSGLATAPGDSPADYNCIGITTAFELDFCMREARNAAQVLDGATGTILKDAGTALGLAGLVPHAGVRAGSAVVGAGLWATTTYFEGWASVLPSELGELTFDLTKEVFLEDEEGSGQWENAEITADSKGWELDKVILDALGQAASLTGPFRELGRRFEGTELSFDDLLGFILSDRVNAAIEATTAGDDLIQIPVETFGPVPIDDPEWSEAEVDALGVLALTDRTTYEPRSPGTGHVILRTVEGTFADQTASSNKPVEVGEITVDIQPDEEMADPGQVFAFDATVENATHPEALEVTADQGEIINVTYEGDGLHTIEYAAPETDEFDDFITARHTANTGARAYSSEERVAMATIRSSARITVSGPGGCVPPGETAQFTVQVVGLDDPTVTWSADVGEIDSTGLYVAPDPAPQNGQAVITATSVTNPDISDSVTIPIGCTCGFSVNVDGNVVVGGPGDQASVQVEISQTTGLPSTVFGVDVVQPVTLSGGGGQVQFRWDPVSIGATGTFATGSVLSGTGSFTPEDTDLGFGTTETQNLTVEITANDGEIFEGTVSGSISIRDENSEVRVGTMTAEFRVLWSMDPTVTECEVGG